MRRQLLLQLSIVFCVVITSISFAAGKDNGNSEEICASGSKWYEGNNVSFKVAHPGTKDFSTYKMEFAENKDFLVTTCDSYEGVESKGKILLISGLAMLTQGIDVEAGYEIDYIDEPALMYQLVISLLDQALPSGPDKTASTKESYKFEREKGIKVATASDSGLFGPSWSL